MEFLKNVGTIRCLVDSKYSKSAAFIFKFVLDLKPGAAVTTSRGDVHYIVTEFGIAHLHGKTLRERAKALIAIAHPDFREMLERQSFESKLLQ